MFGTDQANFADRRCCGHCEGRALDETEIRYISDSRDRDWLRIGVVHDCFGAGLQGLQEHVRLVHDRPVRPIPGNDKQVACHCTVNYSYSAGQQQCTGIKDTAGGQQIRSRYYPVHSYAICSNDRPWAWCLDKPCIIDNNNPQAALCACKVVKNLGDYVIVTDKYTPDTCTSGVISSATVEAITQVTDYLKNKTKKLLPF